MHAHDGQPCAVFAEVNVVSDEPRLVRLDEVDQPVEGGLQSFERSLTDFRRVDEQNHVRFPFGHARIVQETLNVSVARVREPPRAATSPTVRGLPRALAGTRKKHRAIEFSHTRRMFLNRFPPAQTLQWIDPGAGANSTRATSSKG